MTDLSKVFKPKPAKYYESLTNGGQRTVELSQVEECVVLKAHDYGIEQLNSDDVKILDSVVSKLKSEIWP